MIQMILSLMMKIDHCRNQHIVVVKMLRKKISLEVFFFEGESFLTNRNIDEARAIFGDDFNFDGIDFNEFNDEQEDDEDEDDADEDEDMEEETDVEPKYDEDGNLIEDVMSKSIDVSPSLFGII